LSSAMETSFCLSPSPDKQKNGEIPESLICENRRKSAVKSNLNCLSPSLRKSAVNILNAVRIWRVIFLVLLCIAFAQRAEAGFASGFSFAVSEEYNDNILFSVAPEADFITSFIPTFTFLYAPPASEIPTFKANFSSPLQIFANNSDLTNIAQNVYTTADYLYQYSPRLSFKLRNVLQRVGEGRVTSRDAFDFQGTADLVTSGAQFSNNFSIDTTFLNSPRTYFTSRFLGRYRNFIDDGGDESRTSVGLKGFYVWKQEHNLFVGYSLDYFTSRDGETNLIHNIDIGDDFFSNYKLQLTPTLSFSASGGLSFTSADTGQAIGNRVNLILTKVWQRASLTTGVRRRLTNSFGLSGLSQTTTVVTRVNVALSELLTFTADVNFSFFDREDDDVTVFRARTGIHYRLNSWLQTNLRYSYRRRDEDTENINSNSILLFLGSNFDTWPRFGLGRIPKK